MLSSNSEVSNSSYRDSGGSTWVCEGRRNIGKSFSWKKGYI